MIRNDSLPSRLAGPVIDATNGLGRGVSHRLERLKEVWATVEGRGAAGGTDPPRGLGDGASVRGKTRTDHGLQVALSANAML